jgi:hypothetical protein
MSYESVWDIGTQRKSVLSTVLSIQVHRAGTSSIMVLLVISITANGAILMCPLGENDEPLKRVRLAINLAK